VRDDRVVDQAVKAIRLGGGGHLFVTSGMDVPVCDVALQTSVGMGTLCCLFPTRADLVVAV